MSFLQQLKGLLTLVVAHQQEGARHAAHQVRRQPMEQPLRALFAHNTSEAVPAVAIHGGFVRSGQLSLYVAL